jgi:3-oxoacyl-[acyl-carrier-protein] synthase II
MGQANQFEQRVVVTGLGATSCLGVGLSEFWRSLVAGRSGISEVSTVRSDNLRLRRVGEVKDFDAAKLTFRPEAGLLGRTSQFAVVAAQLALEDAGLCLDGQLSGPDVRDQIGVIMGTATGEQQVAERLVENWLSSGARDPVPALMSRISNGVIATSIADFFGFGGYSVVLPTACTGGNYAIAHTYDLLRTGRISLALAGGADCLSRHFLYGFTRLGAIAPERCQPFDRNRKGIIPGEGAGILVLETLESALKRRAKVYSEILGYGISGDACHTVAPDSQGRGMVKAMKDALIYSRIAPQSVQYISAHGTGTVANDAAETKAIKDVFGDYSYQIPISSVKSMLGHAAGAASALEAIVCNLVIRDGIAPPTINYEEKDPSCDLDYIPNVSRRVDVNVAMNNSSAFFGSNASVIFARFYH